ncbi:MAG: XRE family transcriptional regulator [Nitrospinae bacterium]|nr:XRE family transcriptional regulator [Nitrospinota bacterium]
MKRTETIEVTESCGNVFADLGLEDAEELLAKSRLAVEILKIIDQCKLSPKAAASLLGTDQSHISRLKSGQCLESYTFDRLLNWLNKLGRDVTLTVRQKPRSRENALIEVAL